MPSDALEHGPHQPAERRRYGRVAAAAGAFILVTVAAIVEPAIGAAVAGGAAVAAAIWEATSKKE